jgi:NAD-dependent dihydropyrimidine dehydrogenase PreA subunit
MLIISRHRQEAEDSPTASLLAAKFNAVVLHIPFLYDLSADSLVIQRLRSIPAPAYFLVPLSERSVKSLLDYLHIPYADIFETEDAVQIPDGGISDGQVESLTETPKPRWYPVIDDAQCTACLECVNYCLFGVYAIGHDSRPVVDQPDACRDGCPACARVCPSKAIMFPLYEDRVIAGYEKNSADELSNLIDLVDQI